jgi:hypothetical protein
LEYGNTDGVTTINDHNDLRLLVLHRVKKAVLKNEPLRILDDFNLQSYIDQGALALVNMRKP